MYSSAFADIYLDNLLIYQHILKSSYLDGGVLKHREPLPGVCKHNVSKENHLKQAWEVFALTVLVHITDLQHVTDI